MIRGLILGRFHPPHAGHDFLIETARAQVDQLTVVVVDRPGLWIPLALRREWLAAARPQAQVLALADPGLGDNQPAWAEFIKKWLGYTPDVLFSSESYGRDYAELLGCRHVLVDLERRQVPVSAHEVLADPAAYSDFLQPEVLAYLQAAASSNE